jgi:hypothetical protein
MNMEGKKMFELPEFVILAKQMNESLKDKIIQRGMLGKTPHKFVRNFLF